MEISKDEVDHIAKLARIELEEREKEKYRTDLSAILDYAEELESAPVNPSQSSYRAEVDQIAGLENITREDEVKPSLANERVLQNAPAKEKGFIKVKKILQ